MRFLPILLAMVLVSACSAPDRVAPLRTHEILVTSEAGERLSPQPNLDFRSGHVHGPSLVVFPDSLKQEIEGIGTSFTESSAFVLAHLEPDRRHELMKRIYGPEGADFTLARLHLGACDFSLDGRYSYADTPGDTALAHFSIAPDSAGFDPHRHPRLRDPGYDLLPMIREALAIKAAHDGDLRIIGSAWTAPNWMKDIRDWYVPGSAANGWQGTGGSLEPEFVPTYADYLVRAVGGYAAAGVPLWGLTPVNEPHGNGGFWESMHFTAAAQADFIARHLGPKLAAAGHGDVQLLAYDQNRDGLEEWAHAVLGDPDAATYTDGLAVHWYSSTFKVYEDVFERVHAAYPDALILHTEGCIDDLGKDPPAGVGDPAGAQESGWFGNDAFWWNTHATDWAYTAPWAGEGVVDHPMYTPVHRYARDVIVGLDHWVSGWVDWNIVLDSRGGPNHVGNFCGAPIMIDTESGEIHLTPVFHVLAQFSRTIRPGDRAVATRTNRDGLAPDALHACATRSPAGLLSIQFLNTTKAALTVALVIDDCHAEIRIPANAVQTVRIQL